MSHYLCEIVMPPTDDIPAAVASVMKPFDENDGDAYRTFWDFWVIGGRFAGSKRMARYDKASIDEFYAWCDAEKITVAGMQFGKQELSPADQIPKVDAKWQEMFPSDPPIPCPLFRHSNDQYGKGTSGTLPDDVARLSDVARSLEVARVIVAARKWHSEEPSPDAPLEAVFMLAKHVYNGVNSMPIAWDGTLGGALDMHREAFKNYSPAYAEHITPKGDWLVVTVDYHS